MIKAIYYAIAALAVGAAIATLAFAEPLVFVWNDAEICARIGKPAPCSKRCGNLSYKKERQQWVWRDCPEIMRIFQPEPTPAPSPRQTSTVRPTAVPTAAMSPCLTNPAGYCWAKGSALNAQGDCFANCDCIKRQLGACAN